MTSTQSLATVPSSPADLINAFLAKHPGSFRARKRLLADCERDVLDAAQDAHHLYNTLSRIRSLLLARDTSYLLGQRLTLDLAMLPINNPVQDAALLVEYNTRRQTTSHGEALTLRHAGNIRLVRRIEEDSAREAAAAKHDAELLHVTLLSLQSELTAPGIRFVLGERLTADLGILSTLPSVIEDAQLLVEFNEMRARGAARTAVIFAENHP